MTESDLSTVGIWSYGLATVGFLAFAGRLTLGWRPGMRAALLLAATIVTTLWAGAGVAVLYRPGFAMWFASTAADALRYAVWFLFLGSLLHGKDSSARVMSVDGFPKWIVALGAIGLAAC